MTFGSLFAGAGGFDMGLEAAGLRCVWQVEIDRTARSVLARHWPDVKRLEDVRKVGAAELEPVDVLVGGFPCQDLSLAGKRAGLAGDRSGLWWEMLRVVRELQPRLVVWENVPGLRSNDEGRDYPRVLCSLAEHGYFGCVRTLDAQHFGVPQSRPRLFGVFARGPDGAGRAGEILAVRESLPWHSQAGRQAGADITGPLTAGTGEQGWRIGADEAAAGHLHVYGGNDTRGEREVATAINAKGGTGRSDFETENFVLQCHGSNVGPFGTLRRGNGSTTGGVPFVFESKKAGEGRGDGVSPTLRAMGHDGSHANAGGRLAAFIVNSATSCATESHARQADKARSLDTSGGFASRPGRTLIQSAGLIRRFTPRECERLMGWPAILHLKGRSLDDINRTLQGRGAEACPTPGSRWSVFKVRQAGSGPAPPRHHGPAGSDRGPVSELPRSRTPEAAASELLDLWVIVPTEKEAAITNLFGPSVSSRDGATFGPSALGCWARLEGWTQYDDTGREIADGPRYKMTGNGVVRPVAWWLGLRLMECDR